MVIPVHVLDVIRTDHPFALAIALYLMGDALRLAKTGIHTRTIATRYTLHSSASGDTSGVKTMMTASVFIFSS